MPLNLLTVPSSEALAFRAPAENRVAFHCGTERKEIMRLDEQGMTYMGQRIEDAGEAHRAFLKAMTQMQENIKTV
jgi:hypothetical protein